MQKHNTIKALFFLGIFSLLLLHDIIPHTHHQHEAEHSNAAIAHGHSHHDISEQEHSSEGFLGLFLEVHEHSLASNETQLTLENRAKKLSVQKDVKRFVKVKLHDFSIRYNKPERIADYQPPNTYFSSYLSSLDSRGPPSLG